MLAASASSTVTMRAKRPSRTSSVRALIASGLHCLPRRSVIGDVSAKHFAFCNTVLSAGAEKPERETEAITATNGALGQAVGKLYTQRYFPPEAKAKAQAMVRDLLAGYRGRIPKLTWMSVETKQKALAKLVALQVIVGYPDEWIDYSSLEVVRGDALGNMRRAEAFHRALDVSRLRQSVNPIDWPINPQQTGAVIMFSPNAEFFTAGILQPPYFRSRRRHRIQLRFRGRRDGARN